MLIHLIADYGHGDLAFAEVRQRLALLVPEGEVFATPVPAFDTVSAGFCAAELALTDGPAGRVVYMNVAPRLDELDSRPGNQGERLIAALLPDEVVVVGVNSQHSFSFLRDEAVELRHVEIAASGSQFRSRDLFPAAVAELARGDHRSLGDPVRPELLPTPPERAIAYVDGYGNLKTTWSCAPGEVGQQVEVSVTGATASATVSDGTFAVPHGDMSFAPGSSGWRSDRSGERRFYELLLRGGSAWEHFGRPRAGASVDVVPV
ncbi:MAG TPA: hypothetical protein VK975_00560 [Acidimicrobiales bacterium]|nr:hypothetical protein [Acidimicrobiales bacterium]